ncbi:MAG: hypothetical protein AAFX81_01810 [Pseudomonadota bacterium]
MDHGQLAGRALTQRDAMNLTGSDSARALSRLMTRGVFPRPTHPASTRQDPKWDSKAVRAAGYDVPEIIVGPVERIVGEDPRVILERRVRERETR